MNERFFVIAVLSALCITTILAVSTNSLVGYYDPWLDYNDDGDIDMKDVAASARAFGSYGDPTKYVNVTNWPTSNQVTVWWDELVHDIGVLSPEYESFGFCRMHILASASGLTGSDSVGVRVLGIMRNEDHTALARVLAYTITLTASSPAKDATIFVPSETFQISAIASTYSYVSVNFYLTWA